MKKLILLDAGHGGLIDGKYQTSGKRSPIWDDGSVYYEGVGNRLIRDEIAKMLKSEGIQYKYVNEGQKDMKLKERVNIVNAIARKRGAANVFLISIHSNGASPQAHGWECFTSIGQTNSDQYAEIIYDEMESIFYDRKFRTDKWSDGDKDKEARFTIIQDTICPAVLTENFFHTNEDECKNILMTKKGRRKIALGHVKAIKRIVS